MTLASREAAVRAMAIPFAATKKMKLPKALGRVPRENSLQYRLHGRYYCRPQRPSSCPQEHFACSRRYLAAIEYPAKPMAKTSRAKSHSRKAARAASHHRDLQRRAAKADRRAPREKTEEAMQAGARKYPAPPLPRQHQPKPGQEMELNPRPMFEAP